MKADPMAERGGLVHGYLHVSRMLSRTRPGMYVGGVLQSVQDQGIDAVKGQGKKDPEQRGQEEAAQDGEDGMGKKEFGRSGAMSSSGGVFVGRVKSRSVHGTTSVDSEPRGAIEGQVSPERGKGVHRLGEAGMANFPILSTLTGWTATAKRQG